MQSLIIEQLLAWLCLGISLSIYVVLSATRAVFVRGLLVSPDKITIDNKTASTNTQDTQNNRDNSQTLYNRLDSRARSLVYLLQAIAIVAYSLSVAYLLKDSNPILAMLYVTGIIIIISILVAQFATSVLANRYRDKLRKYFYPLVMMLTKFTEFILSVPLIHTLLGSAINKQEETTATIVAALELLEETNVIPEHRDRTELITIRKILRMDSIKVREIMRPRPDVVATSIDTPLEDVARIMNKGGHSKIPVYENDNLDHIQGVVYSRDVFAAIFDSNNSDKTLKSLVKPIIHVPEVQDLILLQKTFREDRKSIAAVIDEHGGFAGLVTFKDLVEEILGEMIDEFDKEPPEIEWIGNNDDEIQAQATISIDQLNQTLGVNLEHYGVDTVAGMIYEKLGKMPSVGDVIDVINEKNVKITIEAISGRRIKRVRIKREPAHEIRDEANS